jgi:hypothetical protein
LALGILFYFLEIHRGDEEEFEKLLNQGLPKFITPVTNFDDILPNSLKVSTPAPAHAIQLKNQLQ